MRGIMTAAVLAAAVPTAAAGQAPDVDAALAARAETFLKARDAFDQAAMVAMMAPDYVEVSPIGEVDQRDKVIGFYAPENKVTAPPMTIAETVAHATGDVGTVTLRVTYAVPGKDGQVQNRSMRIGLIARRMAYAWRFAFVQVTPIRG